jgi:predicted Zn-dependent peptidase
LTRALPIAALTLSPLASSAAEPAKTASAKPATPAKSAPGGSVDRSQPPALPPAPALSLPTPQTRKLPNGLQVDVVEIHKAPVVHVTVMLRAGAVRDPDDLPGLATFTANMLDEGAGKRSALDIADESEFLGGYLRTSAGAEMAQVDLHVPKRVINDGLDLMADVLLRPTFPKEEIERQRDLRKTGLVQLRDQPTAMAPLAFNAIVFGSKHPYGRPTNGTEESTAKLSRERVAEFYATYFHPENARVLVVGDVTADEAVSLLGARLGSWGAGKVPPPPTPPAPAASARTFYIVDKPGAAQTVVRIGHVGVARSTPDYYALQVMNTILGGSFTSRLNQNLRETHGYTYGAGSGYDMRRLAGPFSARASVVTAKTDSSLFEFMKELRGIRANPVGAEELEKAKAYLALGLPGQFEGTENAAGQFVDVLANDLPLDTWNKYIPGVRAVTAADVQRVAQQYIDPDHFVIVVVGDRQAIEPGIRALNEGPVSYRDLWGAELKPDTKSASQR